VQETVNSVESHEPQCCNVLASHSSTNQRCEMIFEQISSGGCRSYLVGCPDTCVAVLIDPESKQLDRYRMLAARHGLRIQYVIDTHTHADHFSAARRMGEVLSVPVVMNRNSPAPFCQLRLDDGDMLVVGKLRLKAMHTPGHTADSMCLLVEDRVFTGDTLLIGGTGRTDLPTGNPEALYDSLFNRLLKLDPATKVFPAHEYKGRESTTIGNEIATNPRLQKKDKSAFVEMMQQLNLSAPAHLTEALRTNLSGGKTVEQLMSEASAKVPFISLGELSERVGRKDADLIVLDVREKEAYVAGHVPGARHIPRGQLELRVNAELVDPTARIVSVCEFGKISTLAAATLRDLGYVRSSALDGGMQAWREASYPLE